MTTVRKALAVLATSLSLTLASCPADAEERRVAPEDFAILPWGGSPGTPEKLKEIYDCGFNLAGFVAPEHLDAVRDAGLKCLVLDHTITGAVSSRLDDPDKVNDLIDKAVTDRLRDHPAVYGWYLRDEPRADYFDCLAKYCDALRERAPGSRSYINLFPTYVSVAGMGVPTYQEYLNSFVSKCRPQFISYDHYAMMAGNQLRDGYFLNIELVRAAAIEHDLPFWNIVLGNAHFHYAEPSDTTFRFQAYTSMAYGARGISYFTYFTGHTGNYRLGAIDQFGHKTPTWDMLRRINLQIHMLAPTLVQLKSVAVWHHPNVPAGCKGIAAARHLIGVEGGDFMVGEFEDADGRPYAMVVNKSLADSCVFAPRFKADGEVQMINAYSGRSHVWGREQNWLAPGQGMLMTLHQK